MSEGTLPPVYPRGPSRSKRSTAERLEESQSELKTKVESWHQHVSESLSRGEAQFSAITTNMGALTERLSKVETDTRRPILSISLGVALITCVVFLVRAPSREDVSSLARQMRDTELALVELRQRVVESERQARSDDVRIDTLTRQLVEVREAVAAKAPRRAKLN